ncbi:MAG: glycosyltransferase [Christensenellales bacterium]
MIVKNEEKVLERCLISCKDLFDEIVIVDTGSTDKTKEIAKKYATKVLDFVWQDNFSKARNFGILNSTCDYFMWLDADDVISKTNLEKLKKLKLELSKTNPNCVFIKYNSGFDENGNVTFSFFRERILKNDRINLFVDPVHEVIIPREKIEYKEDISIDHKKEVPAKKDRNLKIYEKQKKSNFSPRQMFYYARELINNEKYKKAIFWLKKFLKLNDSFVENKIEACMNLASCYKVLNDKDNAKKSLFQSFVYDLPRAEILCEIGNLFLEEQDYQKAIYYFDLATKKRLKKKVWVLQKKIAMILFLIFKCVFVTINLEMLKLHYFLMKKQNKQSLKMKL